MDNQERLIAFISELKNQGQQSIKNDVKKWEAEKEKKVGSLRDTYRMFRYYKDMCPDKYKDFCDDTKDAIDYLEKESSYQGMTWYIALWDLFDRPNVMKDLVEWTKGSRGVPKDTEKEQILTEIHEHLKSNPCLPQNHWVHLAEKFGYSTDSKKPGDALRHAYKRKYRKKALL